MENTFIKIMIRFIMNDVKKSFDEKYCRYIQTRSKTFTNSFSVCKDDGKIFEIAEDLLNYYKLKKVMMTFQSEKIDLEKIDFFNEVIHSYKFIQSEEIINDFEITYVFRNSFGGITIKMKGDIIRKIKNYVIQFVILEETGKKFAINKCLEFSKFDEEKIIEVIATEITKLMYKDFLEA